MLQKLTLTSADVPHCNMTGQTDSRRRMRAASDERHRKHLRRFMKLYWSLRAILFSSGQTHNFAYEQHAQYLTPAFALSDTLLAITPPEYKDMSTTELATLAAELKPDSEPGYSSL